MGARECERRGQRDEHRQLRGGHGQVHGPLARRQVDRAAGAVGGQLRLGQGQPGHQPGGVRGAAQHRQQALRDRRRCLRLRRLLRRQPRLPQARTLRHRARLAAPLRAQHVHPPSRGRGGRRQRLPTRLHHHQRVPHAGRQLEGARPQVARLRRLQRREEPRRHRRHVVRRRDEEGHLLHDELLAASGGRDGDALQRQRGQGRRHGALLRTQRHGQDDAVG
mmetsp:Transcript_11849/g.41542  ORF Transcript_11849/g.41542 Transcript_11849/m.41542 type:complete len:221 (+) Transcript_11849:101-763(+)